MAATDNESNNSSFIEDNDKTSDSSSLLQSSPEPQQVGSPGTDQNLSNAVIQQMKVSSAPSRKKSDSSSLLQSSLESQQLDSLQTDQNLANHQIKITSTLSRKRSTPSESREKIIARKRVCNG